jgi:UDP-glucose 6-dehydrogenase
LGLTYKKNTGDKCETSATTVVNNLINEGTNVRVYIPLFEAERISEEVLAYSQHGDTVMERLSCWGFNEMQCMYLMGEMCSMRNFGLRVLGRG